MKLIFSDEAWEQYNWWVREDRRMLGKIAKLVEDIKRNPTTGLGKPEPLKHKLAGFWSRRITGEHRLVYSFTDDEIMVASCRFHYEE